MIAEMSDRMCACVCVCVCVWGGGVVYVCACVCGRGCVYVLCCVWRLFVFPSVCVSGFGYVSAFTCNEHL
jgi:hypothetical protein